MAGRHPAYLTVTVTPKNLQLIVGRIKKWLKKPENGDVVAIAGRGISGIPLVGALAFSTGLLPLYVRRSSNETEHDQEPLVFSGERNSKNLGRYIIVDDLIDRGTTMNHIIETVGDFKFFKNPRPKAILLYRSTRERPFTPYDSVSKIPVVPMISGGDEFFDGDD